HAVDISENQPVRSFDMQEQLPRGGLATGPLNDLHLVFLHEVAVLHDLIERLHLEGGVEQTVPSRRIESDAVVQIVDAQVSDVSDPVGHLSAEQSPEGEIADVIGAAQADALELHNASVAWRKVASTAPGGACHEVNVVSGCIVRKQSGLHISAP